MVLDGFGWFWMVLDGFGWFWMVLDDSDFFVCLSFFEGNNTQQNKKNPEVK